MDNEERITYFAKTDARGKLTPFGIKARDRTRHVYVIGKTGMGKSTTLENMVAQDIRNGEGFAFVDPHGKSAEDLLSYIPQERLSDVMYFAPFDMEHPIAFNVMEDVGYDKRHLVANGLMAAFKKIWADLWSARMEYILSNTILALLEHPDTTLLDVNRMYTNKDFRRNVITSIQDPLVKSFWVDEFATYTDRYTQEATPAIQNKIGQFTGNPLIRNLIGQPKSSFDLREFMDNRKIILVNLSKGKVGEGNANLLGSMFITKIYLAALSRADASASEMRNLPNFYLFVDEFQSFANESFADILSEARKYKLCLTMAHQYIEQMSEEVRAAVFGNVGTMVAFRVGAFDAEVLEKEFAPQFSAQDLVNLGFSQVYLKLMIDGVASQPFSAETLPPLELPEQSLSQQVIESSRKLYAKPRAEIEEAINKIYAPSDKKTEARLDKSESKEEKGRGASAQYSRPAGRPQYPRSTNNNQSDQQSYNRPRMDNPRPSQTRPMERDHARGSNQNESSRERAVFVPHQPRGAVSDKRNFAREQPRVIRNENEKESLPPQETHQPFAQELKSVLDKVMQGSDQTKDDMSGNHTNDRGDAKRSAPQANQNRVDKQDYKTARGGHFKQPTKNRSISEENRNSLKEALAGIVTKESPRISRPNTARQAKGEVKANHKNIENEENKSKKEQAQSQKFVEVPRAREVSPEVLKDMLESD